ncbi:hypothetical protein BC830DRAFT_451702 [Chytriomyces sp. MP71]|nr:hypothetical protein BC830DRAFT_451702 [Chytriomyces sp. MP71]
MSADSGPVALIAQALKHAQDAVRSDGEGQLGHALVGYRRSLLLLDRVLSESDSAHIGDDLEAVGSGADADTLARDARGRLISLRAKYVARVDEILASTPANVQALYLGNGFIHPDPDLAPFNPSRPSQDTSALTTILPPHPNLFSTIYAKITDSVPGPSPDSLLPQPPVYPPQPAPTEPLPAALSLKIKNVTTRMRVLASTTTTGAFITPRLVVPRQVWVQPPGMRLVAIEAKFQALEMLYMALQGATAVTPATLSGSVAQLRETVDAVIAHPQLQLLKKLQGEISAPFDVVGSGGPGTGGLGGGGWLSKVFNPITSAVSSGVPKGDKVADLSAYVELLARAFPAISAVLDSWGFVLASNKSTVSDNALLQEIELVVKFMDAVVLAFVMRDLERLMDRYIKQLFNACFLEFTGSQSRPTICRNAAVALVLHHLVNQNAAVHDTIPNREA